MNEEITMLLTILLTATSAVVPVLAGFIMQYLRRKTAKLKLETAQVELDLVRSAVADGVAHAAQVARVDAKADKKSMCNTSKRQFAINSANKLIDNMSDTLGPRLVSRIIKKYGLDNSIAGSVAEDLVESHLANHPGL